MEYDLAEGTYKIQRPHSQKLQTFNRVFISGIHNEPDVEHVVSCIKYERTSHTSKNVFNHIFL